MVFVLFLFSILLKKRKKVGHYLYAIKNRKGKPGYTNSPQSVKTTFSSFVVVIVVVFWHGNRFSFCSNKFKGSRSGRFPVAFVTVADK